MKLTSVWPHTFDSSESFDVLICAVGYEERATAVARRVGSKSKVRLAWAFSDRQVLDYSANLEWFKSNDFVVFSDSDQAGGATMSDLLSARLSSSHSGKLTIAVDISCFTRSRLAILLSALSRLAVDSFRLIPIYCLAKFSEPQAATPPNRIVGPVTTDFAGWFSEPERPLAVVAGLGYEPNKALGAVEHLEADYCWALIPTSSIGAYEPHVLAGNATLLEGIPLERRLKYDVEQPAVTFGLLNSLCHGLGRTHNIVLLPFGPKVFSLVCLLVALGDGTSAVWRVSAGEDEIPLQRIASDTFVSLVAIFQAKKPES